MALKMGSNLDLDKVVRSLGQKYKLAPHIDLAINEGGDFTWDFHYEPKTSDDAWHPSGDCTPSLRDLYLKATGQLEVEPISPTLRKIFMVGHYYHQYFQWIVQHKLRFAEGKDIERRGTKVWGTPRATYTKEDLYYGRVVTLEPLEAHPYVRSWPDTEDGRSKIQPLPYHWVTGSADIAPCKIPGAGEYLVDFKTVNSRMFTAGMSPDYLAKWECQGNIYLDFFDLDHALFVLIEKTNGDMKELCFDRNQALIDSIHAKWRLVSECATEGIEPPADEQWSLPLKGPVGT